MSSKTKPGWGAYEFTRATYDEQRTAEQVYQVWISISLHTTGQRGVYDVRVASVPMLAYDQHLKHSVTQSFPNGHVIAFEALVYQLMYRLCRMLEASEEDVKRQRAKLT